MFGRYLWLCGCLAATLGWAAVANAQQYTLVSVLTAGTPGNRDSTGAVFSGDGKVVAFSSLATNLVPGDTNGTQDVFVRDLASHTTTRVSVASDGSESQGFSGKFASSYGANVGLNQDGAIVAFALTAALDPADTNGHLDIYVRDRTLNQTTRVSVASDGGQANDDSTDPHLSGDGRYVVFTSAASNLVSGDNNGFADVFLRDRTTLTTTRLSVSSDGGRSQRIQRRRTDQCRRPDRRIRLGGGPRQRSGSAALHTHLPRRLPRLLHSRLRARSQHGHDHPRPAAGQSLSRRCRT